MAHHKHREVRRDPQGCWMMPVPLGRDPRSAAVKAPPFTLRIEPPRPLPPYHGAVGYPLFYPTLVILAASAF